MLTFLQLKIRTQTLPPYQTGRNCLQLFSLHSVSCGSGVKGPDHKVVMDIVNEKRKVGHSLFTVSCYEEKCFVLQQFGGTTKHLI